MEALIGLLLAGFALAGSPGPNTLSLAATGAAFGWRRGISYLIGLGFGMVLVMAITASGVTGALLAVPGAAPVLMALAAIYFAYLAWRIATAPPLNENTQDSRPPGFAAGILLSLVNPKGYLAMVALFAGFALLPDRPAQDAALKIGVLTLVIFAVNIAWLLAGAALTPLLRAPRASRIVNITFAVLLLLSVAAALVA